MPYYIYAWIGSSVLAVYAIIAKLITKYKIKNPSQFSFFSTLAGGLVTIVISIINGANWPQQWGWITITGLFMALSNLLYINVLKRVEMTIISPMFNLKMVITLILGYLFLGEAITGKMVGLIFMIVVAGVLATMEEKFSLKSFLNKKIFLVIFLMFFASVLTIFFNRTINQNGYWTATLWMVVMSIIFSFLLNFFMFYKDLKTTKLSDYGWIPILAIVGGIGDLASYKALQKNVGVSSIILCLPFAMVMSIILAHIKPDLMEKHSVKVYAIRLMAASVMIFGAISLSR